MSIVLNAQHSFEDSLKLAIKNTTSDTVKIQLMSSLTQYYLDNNLDSALIYGMEIIKLSTAKKYTYGLCKGYIYVSRAYNRVGNYTDGLKMVLRALNIAQQLTYGNKEILCSGYFQLGASHMVMKRAQDATTSLFKSLEFGKESKPDDYFMSLAMLGNVYRQVNQLDSAFMYTWEAYNLSKRYNTKVPQSFILSVLGDIYKSRNIHDSAIFYYSQSLHIAEETDNYFFTARSLTGLAELFHRVGAHDSAVFYGQKALSLSQQYNYQLYVLNASQILMNSYENNNNTDSTLKFMKVMLTANDSMYNQVRAQQYTTILYDELQQEQLTREAEERNKNKNRLLALLTVVSLALITAGVLHRSNRQKQKVNAQLQQTLSHLKATQSQLIQSEKMASLGELTAGIAHEIQNPLNFINNFSEVNKELLGELNEEIDKGNLEEVKILAKDVIDNEQKINHHGKRADAIVKGMLQHSRSSNSQKEPTDINALADEYLRLAYHGLRAKEKNFNVTLKTDYDASIGKINIIPQDIGRVILNLITNAFYAVNEKTLASKASGDASYEATVWISTKKSGDQVLINIKDNGNGIPQKAMDKIFQPFFTTKPTGEGTGLGLSISYDIVKAHGGEMKMESKEGEGATFIIKLPTA
jgi:two-component system, NtrC family, sensor kinase